MVKKLRFCGTVIISITETHLMCPALTLKKIFGTKRGGFRYLYENIDNAFIYRRIKNYIQIIERKINMSYLNKLKVKMFLKWNALKTITNFVLYH
jgi:hypothetical protein